MPRRKESVSPLTMFVTSGICGSVIVVVGGLLLTLKVSLPDDLPRFAEAGAGALLVALGLANLRFWRTRRTRPPGAGLRGALARSASIGLLHGLGFAGALAEIGLPPDRAALALLGFNAGVEVGQLAIVAGAAAVAWAAGRAGLQAQRVLVPCAYVGGSIAFAWTLERLLT